MDNKDDELKKQLDSNAAEILKNFYSEKMTPEGRKFMLLMISKFVPVSMKNDLLKQLIDNIDDAGVEQMFNAYLDLFCSDDIAKAIRTHLDKPEH